MMKKLLINLIFWAILSLAVAEELELHIKYLGIPMVKVNIVDEQNTITTKANAVGLAGIVAKMNNTYISSYNGEYLTTKYSKYIFQKDYTEERQTNYFREQKLAERINFKPRKEIVNYPINEQSRDFFAALFYLRKIDDITNGNLWLDANKSIWKTHYEKVGNEKIKTIFGKINTIMVKLTFEKISTLPKENTDMLTNNLVNEEKSLLLWFSSDNERIPVRAEFMMRPFPVVWELKKYEK